ncbi:hypothetical protein QAD02_019785 [Eretmocerus hayati]|uniref:Uncharacterized protein n=1 Tax=Eretmocerus hayati TaxID=131215 RepID=A0ACC2PKJ6_9HYME|nr:hypothetical protein QAD02_019785 [Eretmocerus hayati]
MPTCIVADCDSGSFRQERRSAQLNERMAFFKLPRDPELANQWKRALKFKEVCDQLKEKKICQRHFHDEDIVKYDEVLLPNGEIWRSERQHYRVRHGAIPFYSPPELIIPDILATSAPIKCEVDDDDDDTHGSNIMEVTQAKSCSTSDADPPVDHDSTSPNSNGQHVSNTSEPINLQVNVIKQYTVNGQTNLQKKTCENTKLLPSVQASQDVSNDLDNQENRAPEVKDLVNEDIPQKSLLNDHQYLSYHDFRRTVAPNPNGITGSESNFQSKAQALVRESRDTDSATQHSRTSDCDELIRDPVAVIVELPFEPLLEPCQSSLDDIMSFLRETPLPRTWSWMKFTRKDNGFTFTQIDCTYRVIRMFVELYEDLTMKVITSDGKASADVEIQLSSPNSIIDALYTIEKMQICMGTGENHLSPVRDDDCCGVVQRNERKQLRPYGRCAVCQKSRMKSKMKMQLKKTSQRATDSDTKNSELSKEVKLLKRKCKYYEDKTNMQSKKINTMIEMIKTVNKSNSAKQYDVL